MKSTLFVVTKNETLKTNLVTKNLRSHEVLGALPTNYV